MSVFAIFFAVFILTLFWGGFFYMLVYSLKLKSRDDWDREAASKSKGTDR